MIKDLKCKTHKAYLALRKPKAACASCLIFWNSRPHLVREVTKPVRNPHAISRLDAEEKRHARVRQDNESYYQNGTAWHMPRGKR